MRVAKIILLVLFVMTMFLWLLIGLGALSMGGAVAWLPFFACLFLGIAVFYDMGH
jgi:hypothetical protein